ncbi:MAG: mannose-1-phosphate guanylyltransferase [Spirochaetaceae bacterium]|jgi:mannose-1-phosphate guanylyltransferase|nr:mannose-1-phosphate guanylyltransferase [Spirochaetaceae bacterium]
MFDECVILAGGSGTRLWPLSNSSFPKQFLPMPGNYGKNGASFFSSALERAFSVLKDDGGVIISASSNMAELVLRECSKLEKGKQNRVIFIPEPVPKNTAAAAACASAFIGKTVASGGGKSRVVLMLTSDHVIDPLENFVECAARLYYAVNSGERLGVFGVKPDCVETGYGYIEAESAELEVSSVLKFHEKPDAETASYYLKSGNFFWNSGMFAFTNDYILEQFTANEPDVLNPFISLKKPVSASFSRNGGVRILDGWDGLEKAYSAAKKISFDRAIAEKAPDIVMARANFLWADAGSWDAYARLAEGAAHPNGVFEVDCEDNFVVSDVPVALCGVSGLVVAVRGGKDGKPPVVFITRKSEAQKVTRLVDELTAAGQTSLL